MNNNNKILTVSYGTFSCTLEGFDDSFDTMKAIAEYFRDLASDDRYFGAEPPQPDADMLARIAQREVSRRVEAHEHDGRIMLKAHEEQVADAKPVTEPAIMPTASPSEEKQVENPVAQTEIEEEVDRRPEESVAPIAALDADSNAAYVEIEETQVDAVTSEASEPQQSDISDEVEAAPVPKPVAEETIEEEIEEAPVVVGALDEEFEDALVVTDDLEEEVEEAPVLTDSFEEEAEDTRVVDAAVDVTEEENTDLAEIDALTAEEEKAETPAPETADLQDVAAFFAESVTTSPADIGIEDEILTTSDVALASSAEDETTMVQEFAAEEVEIASDSVADESFADKLERIRAVVSEQTDDTPETDYAEDIEEPAPMQGFEDFNDLARTSEAEAAPVEETEAFPVNQFVAEAAQDIADAFDADDALVEAESNVPNSDEDDDLDALLRRIEAQEDAPEQDQPFDLSAEIEEEAEDLTENLFSNVDDEEELEDTDIHGRVLKVNRADLEAALEAGDLQEYGEADEIVGETLSEEDAFDLQSDFADLSNEENDTPATERSAARESLPKIDTEDDEDVSRLMAEADQQMQEPEGKTRRSAFAHLRAAVAARFADRSMDESDKSVEEAAKAYRSDLAEVVKPRRPIATSRSERPSDARPAPLKLVAEQRIDPEMSKPRGPVSPRRVAAADDHDLEMDEDTGFADYAEEHDAKTLPELLEAAAAYLAYVEGHEQFSRPQLMSRVRQADCGDFSREDGLRSFGQLLRTGKIEKIKGGRFAASETIGFKPDHRAAG